MEGGGGGGSGGSGGGGGGGCGGGSVRLTTHLMTALFRSLQMCVTIKMINYASFQRAVNNEPRELVSPRVIRLFRSLLFGIIVATTAVK